MNSDIRFHRTFFNSSQGEQLVVSTCDLIGVNLLVFLLLHKGIILSGILCEAIINYDWLIINNTPTGLTTQISV